MSSQHYQNLLVFSGTNRSTVIYYDEGFDGYLSVIKCTKVPIIKASNVLAGALLVIVTNAFHNLP